MKNYKRLIAIFVALVVLISSLSMSWATAETNSYSYYCGFEGYVEQIEGISFDSKVATVVDGDAYKGLKALKLTLPEKGITAFELRDANPFDIVVGKEYEISFAYKTSGNIELSAGIADAGNVVNTAAATESVALMASDDWKTSFISVTPDKSSLDGYVLAFTVYADTAAEVYFDDVTIIYKSEGAVPLGEIDFGFTAENTFPTLNVFSKDAVTPTVSEIWDGKTLTAPIDLDSDGVYEINNGAELAYVIKTAAGGGLSYVLTNDIYLNDVTRINWTTGEVEDGYADICDLVKLNNIESKKDKISVSADADRDGILNFILDAVALRTALIK